jgi:hypothetical protein
MSKTKTALLKIVERKADLQMSEKGEQYAERVYKALWYDDTEPYWKPLTVFQVPRVGEVYFRDSKKRVRARPTLVMEIGKLYSVRVLKCYYMRIGNERRLNAFVVDLATEVQTW